MGISYYDEVEIEDMTWDESKGVFHYPCPCGDRFEIALADLREGEEVAVCPGCSLMIKVIFDVDDLPPPEEQEEENLSNEQTAQVVVVAA